MPFEKRRRGSGSFGEDASVEQWRSSRNEMDVMPGGEDLLNNMASAPFEGQSAFPEGPEQMMPEADGIDKVMEDEFGLSQGRPSSLGGAPLLTHVDEPVEPAAKQAARKSKRKMLLDRELQITTESMKHQLADSSATVRDLTVPSYAAAEHGHTGNSLLALPSLPHVSPEILDLSVSMMHDKEPQIKKARHDDSAHAEQPAAGAPFADEPLSSPPMADGMGRPSDVNTRGSHGGDGMPPTPGFADEMDVPEQRQSTEQVPSFQASHVLPEVDGNAVGEKDARAGQVENDPVRRVRSPPRDPPERPVRVLTRWFARQASWSMRTQKMYAMLSDAFDESAGMGLSYDAMIAKTKSKQKRRVVAGCFQELLFLTTHGLTDLAQHKPWGDIVVTKTEMFDQAIKA